MRRVVLLTALLLFPFIAWGAASVPENVASSMVMIINYADTGKVIGWGSGFFVDEGIVITNKHVIEAGDWYRVYATGSDGNVNVSCYQKITKSNVRVNVDDDVAYIRAYLPCDHGVLDFAFDPEEGDPIEVLGFPYRGSFDASLEIAVSTGSVMGSTREGWMYTDAYMDIGSSGGPVIDGQAVLGVAVAKAVDDQGAYVVGYFIPSSTIEEGLLYANDSFFGYTPRSKSSSSRRSIQSSAVSSSSSSTSSRQRLSSRSSSSQRSSRQSSADFFADVPQTREGYEAILSLHNRGIITGYSDGTYRPDAGINRAEFIKILVAGFRTNALRGESQCFSDVNDEWFAAYICTAKRLGWIHGYPDGTFRPSQQVNRAEAMKIIVGAFGDTSVPLNIDMPTDVRRGTWFYPYVAAGVWMGMVNANSLFHPGFDLTREHAALWVAGATER